MSSKKTPKKVRKLVHNDQTYDEKCDNQELLSRLKIAVQEIFKGILDHTQGINEVELVVKDAVQHEHGDDNDDGEEFAPLLVKDKNFFELLKVGFSCGQGRVELEILEECIAFFLAKILYVDHAVASPSFELFCALERVMNPQQQAARTRYRIQHPMQEGWNHKEYTAFHKKYEAIIRRAARKFEAKIFSFVSNVYCSCACSL